MKTSALVFLCAFSLSLAYFDDYIEGTDFSVSFSETFSVIGGFIRS